MTLFTEGCSSRSTPRPRPPHTTLRPNITFQTYACPPAYAAWYCLNGATCFTVKISESILYNCECADGYMGQRCEYKDLDGSYLPAGGKVLLETASIAGGAALIILLVFFGIFSVFVLKNKQHERELEGVPHINININNSWPGTHENTTPVHYYEHHTITTCTPSHHEIPFKSPHHSPPHHSTSLPSSTPSVSSHSLVCVGGKTLSSDDGCGEWGTPDRIVKTVTTITDLASIYSGRKQAVHRVEVVQEVDQVSGEKVPLTAHHSSLPASPWGGSGAPASPWTVVPASPHFKKSPSLHHTADDQKIIPSNDPKLHNFQNLVTETSNEERELPALPPPVGGDVNSMAPTREDLAVPGREIELGLDHSSTSRVSFP
ncbi:EGF-like domain [Trinorchestia longiramus]|nr:EGF-like domain [Trinorchestia longiramus]